MTDDIQKRFEEAAQYEAMMGSGVVGLLSIGFGCFALHRQIKSEIDEVKRL